MPADILRRFAWLIRNALIAPYRAVWHAFYSSLIVKVGQNDETNSCNSQMGYKPKFLKHVGTDQ